MIISYDPNIDGRELSSEEIQQLTSIKPNFQDFSLDEPEFTEELAMRVKIGEVKPGRIKTLLDK